MDPALWRKCHEEMVMNSANHKILVAEGIGHDILSENPGFALNAVIKLVNSVSSR